MEAVWKEFQVDAFYTCIKLSKNKNIHLKISTIFKVLTACRHGSYMVSVIRQNKSLLISFHSHFTGGEIEAHRVQNKVIV